MFTDREILVVEAEFLIALEIQRILEEAHAARMVFARSSQEAEALAYRLPQYDLVIVELILGDDASERFAQQALQAGTPLVLTGGSPDGAAAFPGVPFVTKPFTEATLLAAAAAASRPAAQAKTVSPAADRRSPASRWRRDRSRRLPRS